MNLFTLKFVAILEFAKGLIILLSIIAIFVASNDKALSYLPAYIQHIYLPSIATFLYMKVISFVNGDLNREYFLFSFATLYSFIRFVEAYGLWKSKNWGYSIGIISVSLYLPIELFEIIRSFEYYKMLITAFNVAILIYLVKSRRIIKK